LSLFDPDFTIHEYQTVGSLSNNAFVNHSIKHNCLSWFTTAPIGINGQSIMQMLGMKADDISNECHSYVVAFHKYLIQKAFAENVTSLSVNEIRPAMITYWTNQPIDQARLLINSNPNLLLSPEQQKTSDMT
jgi:hypothetical protein